VVRDAVESQLSSSEWRVPITSDPPCTLGRNPLRARDVAPEVSERMLATRHRLADDTNGQIGVHATTGTSWLLWNHVSQATELPQRVEWLVNDHRIPRANDASELAARVRLLGALGAAHISEGTVIQDQRLERFGYDGVPRDVGRALLATVRSGWMPRRSGVWVASHERNRVASTMVRFTDLVQEGIQRAADPDAIPFEPENWAFWRDDPRTDPPTVDDGQIHVVMPERFAANHRPPIFADRGYSCTFADVNDATVLSFHRLDDSWVEGLRTDAVAYLDDRIRSSGPVHQEWKHMCEHFGRTDPIDRWNEYRASTLEV
jgi:hypothetical protein